MADGLSSNQKTVQTKSYDLRRMILTDAAYYRTGILVKILYTILIICGPLFYYLARHLSQNYSIDDLPIARLVLYFPRSEFDYSVFLSQHGPAAALECLLFEGLTMAMTLFLGVTMTFANIFVFMKLGCKNSFQPYRDYKSTSELLFKFILSGAFFVSYFFTQYDIYSHFSANASMYPFYFGMAFAGIAVPFALSLILMRHFCRRSEIS